MIQKLSIARGIITKLRHYASTTTFRSVYFCSVYSHLHCGVYTWGNTERKYINKLQFHQNCIIKIITKFPFVWTKLNPIYSQMNQLKISRIYNLEVLKIMYKINTKTLFNCYGDFLRISSKMHRRIVIQLDLPPVIIIPYFV